MHTTEWELLWRLGLALVLFPFAVHRPGSMMQDRSTAAAAGSTI